MSFSFFPALRTCVICSPSKTGIMAESKPSSKSNMAQSKRPPQPDKGWNENNFSYSSNALLERLSSKSGNTIIDIIGSYYSDFDDNLSSQNQSAKPGRGHI